MNRFVFHDPTGARSARLRRASHTAAIFAVLALCLLTMSVWSSPQLPHMGLPEVEHLANIGEVSLVVRGDKLSKNIPFKLRKDARTIKYVRSGKGRLHARAAAPSQPLVFGYFVNWDPASLVALQEHLPSLTHLVAEWLVLKDGTGNLVDESDPAVIQIARDANLPILAMVTNFREGWRATDLHHVLHSPRARANLIDNIAANLAEHRFAGVNIDLEQLPSADRAVLPRFMHELHDRLAPAGYLITQSVPVDDNAYDLKRLATWCDYIVPMLYDEHYQSGRPGPVASQDWFDTHLERLAATLPPEKTIIGIPTYGYDWTIGGTGAAEVTFADVMAAAIQHKASVAWDDDVQNPRLRFDAAGKRHEVWFTDAVTGLNQVKSIAESGFRGYGLWRLGAEDPDLWKLVGAGNWATDAFDPARLAVLAAQKGAPSRYGSGEVIRIVATPADGHRSVWEDRDGDFAEKYEAYPTYYVINRWGMPPNKSIALTFDDGPDREFTAQILDILKAKQVPATFFVVGVNAEQFPDMLQRIYAEGHEIGNHTYSHPNVAETSAERTRLELDATQRIVENTVGVSTILFRPPYNADSEPTTPEEILPILRAQDLGYLTIAENIDPRDWEPGITADQVLNEIEAEVDNGRIVLLHDAGGNRAATVAALPRIIDYFQSRGYRLVRVSELIGKSRDEVMPVPPQGEMRWARIEGQAFDFKGNFKKAVGLLFLWTIYLTLARSLVFGTMAVWQKLRAKRRRFAADFQPPVSVIIAAYNEEKVIRKTIESIVANGYPAAEIVVVDDGSSDETLRVLHASFGSDPRVRILTQANAGKSAALNAAVAAATHEVLIAIDADTVLRRGTIGKLVRHFADPEVAAVSGNARVGNRRNWITRFQAIEYIYGFNLDRRALDLINAITVVPGAVGAWRKSQVVAVGGFGSDTLAEDTDVTLALRRRHFKIRYEQEAVAYTEAPEDTRSLARQRFRWAFGTLQAAWKHRDATFDPRYGTLGFVALPSIWVFQVLLSSLSPFAELAMLMALIAGNWKIVLLYYLAFFLLEFVTGLLAYALEGEAPWDLSLLLFQRIYYRALMQFVLIRSLLSALQGRLVGWGKLERHATVAVEAN